MDSSFKVFDFHRIFLGDAPALYLLEIVFRTIIMYTYTVVLLRILGKRGMGQLSMLELAIIIAFGSAVGDPMVGAEMPILHGMTAITVVTIFQIGLERLINMNKKVEAIMEGTPNLVINNGIIQWNCMKEDNISKEDLFRALRGKDVEHLGQVQRAYFETSGQISVIFNSPKKIKPGLSVMPEEEFPEEAMHKSQEVITEKGIYTCMECGATKEMNTREITPKCEVCENERWIKATI
jgi:uncharacterized membrane protein YcaP (DUF421 family)